MTTPPPLAAETPTPVSQKHVGMLASHRFLGAMFDDMVKLERRAILAEAKLAEMRGCLERCAQVLGESQAQLQFWLEHAREADFGGGTRMPSAALSTLQMRQKCTQALVEAAAILSEPLA